jgi:hypothetical protein
MPVNVAFCSVPGAAAVELLLTLSFCGVGVCAAKSHGIQLSTVLRTTHWHCPYFCCVCVLLAPSFGAVIDPLIGPLVCHMRSRMFGPYSTIIPHRT